MAIQKTLAIIILFIVSPVAGFLYNEYRSSASQPDSEHVVELSKDEFRPQELTIEQGDTVTFITMGTEPFWPASDPHPTHKYLNGFDPERELAADESWDFTFTSPGSWDYHNHLGTSYRGTIIVLDKNSDDFTAKAAVDSSCEGREYTGGRCFDKKIKEVARTEGVGAAFKLFAAFYKDGKSPTACHWTGHRIGEEAYEQFNAGKQFIVTPASYYCGYGFYHGFLEASLRDDRRPGKIDKILAFCEYVDEQLGGEAKDNCFHGLGSGLIDDPPAASLWGNEEDLVAPGLAICENIFGQNMDWEICTTGVYAVIANFKDTSSYGFFMEQDDPFAFCRTQNKKYHRACYGEFAPKITRITGQDIAKVNKFIIGMDEEKLIELVLRVAASSMMQRDAAKDDQIKYIYNCRKFSDSLYPVCLDGVIWGLSYHGELDNQHVKMFEFCEAKEFSETEEEFCYKDSFYHLARTQPQEQMQIICETSRPKYRGSCYVTANNPQLGTNDKPQLRIDTFGESFL